MATGRTIESACAHLPSKFTGVFPLTQLRPPFSIETFHDSGDGDLIPEICSGDFTSVIRSGILFGSVVNSLVATTAVATTAAAAASFWPFVVVFEICSTGVFFGLIHFFSPPDGADAVVGAAFATATTGAGFDFGATLRTLLLFRSTALLPVLAVLEAEFGATGRCRGTGPRE